MIKKTIYSLIGTMWISLLLVSCNSDKSNNNNTNDSSKITINSVNKDSLKIANSNEYKMLIKFLNWYKLKHE